MYSPTFFSSTCDTIRCKYPSKRCEARRAIKRSGELHRFCELHRAIANRNQRRLDRKRRSGAKFRVPRPPVTAPTPVAPVDPSLPGVDKIDQTATKPDDPIAFPPPTVNSRIDQTKQPDEHTSPSPIAVDNNPSIQHPDACVLNQSDLMEFASLLSEVDELLTNDWSPSDPTTSSTIPTVPVTTSLLDQPWHDYELADLLGTSFGATNSPLWPLY